MKARSKNQVCPGCGSKQLSPFYEVRDVPVHSCVMLASREQALRFPRGDILLAFCENCGFITNIAYDPPLQGYSAVYEDQQSFSPTFNSFARRLAETLIEKHNLYRKDILEIGCGKGDFLVLLCELGNNRGIGIDPACIQERMTGKASERIKLIPDYYSEKYAHYGGDFVSCRHTLEHIHPTFEFVQTVRRAINGRLHTPVFFEVPDTTRVLREGAFWDIYYEHCSYFTPGSLGRLFRRCGFEVLDLSVDYGDQYLLIEAKPCEHPCSQAHVLEESVEVLSEKVKLFAELVGIRIEHWRARVQEYIDQGKRVAIWGSGSKCVAFLTTLGIEDGIEYVVDINPHRHGKFIPGAGKQIIAPQRLGGCRPEVVFVMNAIYANEVQSMLSQMGLRPEVISV